MIFIVSMNTCVEKFKKLDFWRNKLSTICLRINFLNNCSKSATILKNDYKIVTLMLLLVISIGKGCG